MWGQTGGFSGFWEASNCLVRPFTECPPSLHKKGISTEEKRLGVNTPSQGLSLSKIKSLKSIAATMELVIPHF